MRIVLVTSCFKEEVAYQENYLIVGLRELGHEVALVTGELEYDFGVNEANRRKECGVSLWKGIEIHRLPIAFEMKNRFVICKGLYGELSSLKPDIIFFYDHAPMLFTCIRYKKKMKCQLFVFVHSDVYNTMNSFFGKPYHKILWRNLIRYTQKYYDKVLCGTPECGEFSEQIYGINPKLIRIVSLPGDASLMKNYDEVRGQVRRELGITDNEIAVFHTGKLFQKKKTREVLQAIDTLGNPDVHLYIIGWLPEDLKPVVEYYCQKNPRIHFGGWKEAEELKRMLLGADILLQPGSPSNTFIEAICCGVPLVLNDIPQGRFLTRYENGYLLAGDSVLEIQRGLEKVLHPECLQTLKKNAINASSKFHYKEIARQTLEK